MTTTRHIRHLVLLFVVFILCVTSVAAQEQFAVQEQGIAPKAAKGATMPFIHRASVDSTTNQITVEGVNFGDTPIVEIEGVILTLVSNTPTLLVANLPPNLPPASYLLKVIANSNPDSKKKVLFEVTIGAVGPTGPQGETGAQGPPGVPEPPLPGSPNYIQNTTTPQSASFNISGNGTAGGTLSGSTLSGNTVNAATAYNIGGNRVLSLAGNFNTFAGVGAGANASALTNNSSNSFFGRDAGFSSTQSSFNSFFGRDAGRNNIDGNRNSFFGRRSGISNTTGNANTIIGSDANVSSGNLSFATAIGADAVVSTSNTIQLGRATGNDQVRIPGQLSVSGDTTTRHLTVTNGISMLGNSLILSPIAGDLNHSIVYSNISNGIQFRAFDRFAWLNVRNNRINMVLETDGDLLLHGSYQQISDARYKTNVQTFGNALDAVRRLRGVTFNWKPEHNNNQQTQIGFIAQEVEAVLPELVSTDEQGYKSVSYSNAVPVLVEAIKDQQMQIERQQLLIDGLRKLVCQNNPHAEVCR